MKSHELSAAFEEVFDHGIVFHGSAENMRDYGVFIHVTADPRTGIKPEYLRYRFTHCVRATVKTAVSQETWARSLDERLLDYNAAIESGVDGYVWALIITISIRACPSWRNLPKPLNGQSDLAFPFLRLRLRLMVTILSWFSASVVTKVGAGFAPFVIPPEGPDPWATDSKRLVARLAQGLVRKLT